jgi:hypothetical protein
MQSFVILVKRFQKQKTSSTHETIFAGVVQLLGSLTFHQRTGVQLSSPAPCVPFVQWIRTERYERSDSGSSPERDTRVCGVVAERQRRLTVYEDQVGSTPTHFANSLTM